MLTISHVGYTDAIDIVGFLKRPCIEKFFEKLKTYNASKKYFIGILELCVSRHHFSKKR